MAEHKVFCWECGQIYPVKYDISCFKLCSMHEDLDKFYRINEKYVEIKEQIDG